MEKKLGAGTKAIYYEMEDLGAGPSFANFLVHDIKQVPFSFL